MLLKQWKELCLPIFSRKDRLVHQSLFSSLLSLSSTNLLPGKQVCSNGTRILVHKSVLGPFVREFVKATAKLTIGDPLKNETKVGATITRAHAEKVLNYIDIATCEVILLEKNSIPVVCYRKINREQKKNAEDSVSTFHHRLKEGFSFLRAFCQTAAMRCR